MDHTSAAAARGPLSAAYLTTGTSSFTDFLSAQAPNLLPSRSVGEGALPDVPHGTTIVALTFDGGVLIAGDRRATAGNVIAARDLEKIFITDEYSAVGIAGTAGIALEIVRLYAVELAHYEKIEGVSLSLDGKANKLATMVRSNLEVAMAGLAAVPMFVGFDPDASDLSSAGRIISFDVTGGRYEERAGFHAIGSGAPYAKSALKKLYDSSADKDAAVRSAVASLYDAGDDDTATSGFDMVRRIYPQVVTITAAEGAVQVPESDLASVAESVVAERSEAGG
ncbi:proteasome subunit beta [Haloechinothrix salitolerans]|uniref:Proteasome subunit beta n=1 Tax=Haloechinothrix salitolerans TaxID=926830 RepID=A0ABW2C3T0_9PSEU